MFVGCLRLKPEIEPELKETNKLMVYVDQLFTFGGDTAPRCFRNKPSCHMYADTLEELHIMAIKIGLKREWFQENRHLNHYDLTPSKRVLALRKGAIEHTSRDMVKLYQK